MFGEADLRRAVTRTLPPSDEDLLECYRALQAHLRPADHSNRIAMDGEAAEQARTQSRQSGEAQAGSATPC